MISDDEAIRKVREVREKISVQFNNDPRKLVEHLMEEQRRLSHRLLQTDARPAADATDDVPHRS